jgi:hypothetical protein
LWPQEARGAGSWPRKPNGRKKSDVGNSKMDENQWIGSRENLQETIDFPMKYGAFL